MVQPALFFEPGPFPGLPGPRRAADRPKTGGRADKVLALGGPKSLPTLTGLDDPRESVGAGVQLWVDATWPLATNNAYLLSRT